MVDIPAQFDHRYQGPVIEFVMSAEEIIAACGHGANVLACSMPGEICVIYLPNVGRGGVGAPMRKLLERWEHARCNGWRGSGTVY